MIDWITAEIPCTHSPIPSGRVIIIDEHGAEEVTIVKFKQVEGSYSKKISVRSSGSTLDGMASHMRISGNPAKFLQGHNVFGGDDLSALMVAFTNQLFLLLDLEPPKADREHIRAGEYNVSRIDINYGYSLKTRADVRSWLRAAEFKARSRSGRPQFKGTTLYFQKTSRRWSIKFYSKGDEIEAKGHQLPDQLINTDIPKFADNLLRCELTLRSLELKELNCKRAKFLTQSKLKTLYSQYLGRIDMKAQMNLKDEVLENLPRHLQASYLLWKEGHSLILTMKETTFYRHRSQLLKYNIDISLQPDSITKMDNVVPLIRVLEAEPVSTPSWAYKLGLVAC